MTLADSIEAIRPSIVQIGYEVSRLSETVRRRIGQDWANGSLGTGFFVNSAGYVITARHVITEGTTFLNQIQAGEKRMVVGLAIPNAENMRGNFILIEFELIDEDERHDLALLKLKRNPFKGEVTSGIKIGNQETPLPVLAAPMREERPRDGEAIAISGYPLGQPVLITNAGSLATVWSYDTAEVRLPGAPEWFRFPDIADSYLADVETNRGNSGGPVYLSENGTVIGVCVGAKAAPVRYQGGSDVSLNNQQLFYSSGLTVVVPARYVIELLKKNGLDWNSPVE